MKSRKVMIIDYGMGNLHSIMNAFKYLNIETDITNNPKKISNSNILILPGVGSFHQAMTQIKKKNIDQAIYETIKKGNFLFGICLGMQLLGQSSTEDKYTVGLGVIRNKIKKFINSETKNKKIPHVGFNSVQFDPQNKLFKGLKNKSDFYFVHSYRMLQEKLGKNISTTEYGINFLSSFNNENIFATQFHPEKSQSNGLKVIENFIQLT